PEAGGARRLRQPAGGGEVRLQHREGTRHQDPGAGQQDARRVRQGRGRDAQGANRDEEDAQGAGGHGADPVRQPAADAGRLRQEPGVGAEDSGAGTRSLTRRGTMTLFGKILVVLNLVLGMLMLSWALGIYTQRIDWHSKGGSPDKPQGEIAKRSDRVVQLWRSLQGAESRWRPAWANAWVPQQQRAMLDKWYETQVKTLDAGQAPVKWMVYKDGRMVIATDKATGLFVPLLEEGKDRAGQPLRSLEVYKQEIEATQKGIQVELEKLLKAQKEDTELT